MVVAAACPHGPHARKQSKAARQRIVAARDPTQPDDSNAARRGFMGRSQSPPHAQCQPKPNASRNRKRRRLVHVQHNVWQHVESLLTGMTGGWPPTGRLHRSLAWRRAENPNRPGCPPRRVGRRRHVQHNVWQHVESLLTRMTGGWFQWLRSPRIRKSALAITRCHASLLGMRWWLSGFVLFLGLGCGATSCGLAMMPFRVVGSVAQHSYKAGEKAVTASSKAIDQRKAKQQADKTAQAKPTDQAQSPADASAPPPAAEPPPAGDPPPPLGAAPETLPPLPGNAPSAAHSSSSPPHAREV